MAGFFESGPHLQEPLTMFNRAFVAFYLDGKVILGVVTGVNLDIPHTLIIQTDSGAEFAVPAFEPNFKSISLKT